jgi:hypothetical protein
LLALVLITILYPLLYIVSASFSGSVTVMSISLFPRDISLLGYRTVLNYKDVWTGYANSLLYTVVGTAISLLITVFCAYPLSRKDFRFRNVMMTLCMITMYFSGGLIPTYLTVRDVNMLDTIWAVVLPGAMSISAGRLQQPALPVEHRVAAIRPDSGGHRPVLRGRLLEFVFRADDLPEHAGKVPAGHHPARNSGAQ